MIKHHPRSCDRQLHYRRTSCRRRNYPLAIAGSTLRPEFLHVPECGLHGFHKTRLLLFSCIPRQIIPLNSPMVIRRFSLLCKDRDSFSANLGVTLKGSRLAHLRAGRFLIDGLLWPADYLRVRRKYMRVFGRKPQILDARTFNEKLQQYKTLPPQGNLYTMIPATAMWR